MENHDKHALWPTYNAWTMMLASLVFVISGWTAVFLAVAMGSFLVFVVIYRSTWQQFGGWGGLANVITASRLLLIAVVVWQSVVLPDVIIFVTGILTLVADGLDGYFARKHNTVSAFGDCFDKETDAFFVLAYGVMIHEKELAGAWVLMPGLLRYMYVIMLSLVKIQPEVPSPSFRRQFIGMWLMGTLLAPFVVPPLIYIPGLIFAIAIVMYSFAVDLGKMLRRIREQIPQ